MIKEVIVPWLVWFARLIMFAYSVMKIIVRRVEVKKRLHQEYLHFVIDCASIRVEALVMQKRRKEIKSDKAIGKLAETIKRESGEASE